jgi:hypothetical protein
MVSQRISFNMFPLLQATALGMIVQVTKAMTAEGLDPQEFSF